MDDHTPPHFNHSEDGLEHKSESDGTELDELEESEAEEIDQEIDITNFFNYQRAINSLIDYLNRTIDDIIAGFTRSDQQLFTHMNRKLILNAILESGFYEFCKYRLAIVAESDAMNSQEKFLETMELVQGEIDLLGYLLVHTRLAHRTLNFDLYLSLLKGGLFNDILDIHDKIVKDMQKNQQKINKESIKDNIKLDDNLFYI